MHGGNLPVVEVGVGSAVVNLDVPFNGVLDTIDGGFMFFTEARKDRLFINSDFIWLKLATSDNPTTTSYVGLKQTQILSTMTAGYEIHSDEHTTFDIFAGSNSI